MKKLLFLTSLLGVLHAWETTTHRAIDRTAIESTTDSTSSGGVLSAPSSSKAKSNLEAFVKNAGIVEEKYYSAIFEGYTNKDTGKPITYFDYFKEKFSSDVMADWEQTFNHHYNFQDLIEAGTMLEDAVWQDEDVIAGGGDGRFNNHFYEAQNNGHKLTYGYGFHVNAVDWATNLHVPTANPNLYNYPRAMRYFKLGFTESDPNERRKYQAKMLVSVGHLMHLVNDMNVPAHVRDDSHPLGDPLEVWMRGGWDGKNKEMGFHVMGSQIKGNISGKVDTTYKRSTLSDFMTSEASYTSRNFLSASTLNLNSSYKPNTSTISYSKWYALGGGVSKRYVRNANKTKIALELKSHICDNLITLGVPRGRGLCGNSVIKGDYSVLKDSGQVLIKRAISNATGFVNYFFRGQISAKIDGENIIIKNISDKSLVKDGHTATLRYGGAFHFKYTTNNDDTLRDFEFMRDMDRYEPNIESVGEGDMSMRIGFVSLVSLAPGESIVVAIKRDGSITGKNIVVVYDGKIGDERGIAVCNAQTPDRMIN